jgi:thiol-disulfide isomerase/thioredoxin
MINLSKGLDFEGYLDKNTEEQKVKLLKAYDATRLSKDVEENIKALDKKVNVVVFSEGYCPDCVVTLPLVKRMEELSDNIKVFYYGMQGNKELLEEYTGTARIPTVMAFTEDMQPKGAYVEVPEEVANKVSKLPSDKQKEIIMEYRQGKYNDLIEKDLLSILT